MKGRNRLIEHRRRWQSMLTGGDDVVAFRNRVLSAVDDAIGMWVVEHPWPDKRFAKLLGLKHPGMEYSQDALLRSLTVGEGKRFVETLMGETLAKCKTLEGVVDAVQAIFWVFRDSVASILPGDHPQDARQRLDALEAGVKEAVDLSPGIDLKLARRGDAVILYPGGAPVLDKAVIEDMLGFSGQHQKVGEKFGNVLHAYLAKDRKQARSVLDDLRFCLEQLIREILNNRKSLENQAAELGAWLDGKHVHVHVRNMYATLLSRFAAYQNDAVKHDEKWSQPEIEFMIYLTGTFMRMLLDLEDMDPGSARQGRNGDAR